MALKKGFRILARVLAGTALLVLGAVMLLQTDKVQNAVVQKVIGSTLEKSGIQLTLGSVRFEPFNTIIIKDAVLLDPDPYCDPDSSWPVVDTVARVDKAYISFSLSDLLFKDNIYKINRVRIDGGEFNLVIETGESSNNITRITIPDYVDTLRQYSGVRVPLTSSILAEYVDPHEDSDGFELKVSKIDIKDFRYTMKNYSLTDYKYTGAGMNWMDLDLTGNLQVKNLRVKGLHVSGEATHLDAIEKTGYHLEHAEGLVDVDNKRTIIDRFRLCDKWSDIGIRRFWMVYPEGVLSFVQFVDRVLLGANFEPSVVGMQSIRYYSDLFKSNHTVLDLHAGGFNGPVNGLNLVGINATDKDSRTHAIISGYLGNAASAEEEISFDAKIKQLSFTTKGIGKIIRSFVPDFELDFSDYAAGQPINLTGSLAGSLNDLGIDISIDAPFGGASSMTSIKGLTAKENNISISERLLLHGLSPRDIVPKKDIDNSQSFINDILRNFGPMDTELSANIFIDSEGVTGKGCEFKGSAQVGNYLLNGIELGGSFNKNSLLGYFNINDSNLEFSSSGRYTLQRNGRFDFIIPVLSANLLGLGLTNQVAEINSESIFVKLDQIYNSRRQGYDYFGSLVLNNLTLTDQDDEHDYGTVTVNSQNTSFSIESSFLDINYRGAQVTSIAQIVQEATTIKYLPSLYNKMPEPLTLPAKSRVFAANATFKQTNGLIPVLLQILEGKDNGIERLRIANGTTIKLRLDENGLLTGSANASYLTFNNLKFNAIDIELNNEGNKLNLSANTGRIANTSSKDSPAIVNNCQLAANIADPEGKKNSLVSLKAGFDARDSEGDGSYGMLYFDGSTRSMNNAPAIILHPKSQISKLCFNHNDWYLSEDSSILFWKNGIKVTDFGVEGDYGKILAHGGFAFEGNDPDTLRLNVNGLDLALVNTLVGTDLGLKGTVTNSSVTLASPLEDFFNLVADVSCKDIEIGGYKAGDMFVKCTPDDAEDFNLEAALVSPEGKKTINANGAIYADTKTMRLNASFNSLPLAFASTAVKNLCDIESGVLNGRVSVRIDSSRISNFHINSKNLSIQDAMISIPSIGQKYSLNGSINLNNNELGFKNAVITDTKGGIANINGGLVMHKGVPTSLNASLEVNELSLLNKKDVDGSFYGTLFASGRANVRGPLDNINVSADVKTVRGGQLHIPLQATALNQNADVLSFVERKPIEDEDDEDLEEANSSRTNIVAHCKLTATPDFEAWLELDKNSGNIIRARGNGEITLDLNTSKNEMLLGGNYNITSGKFHFSTLGNIISKDFNIENGSTITLAGPVENTSFDVNALHMVTTPLSNLISDTTSVSTRKDVECRLNISGRLNSMEVKPSVSVRDLDVTTRSLVESELNTQDKVQKQFVALLLFGTFIPNQQSGVVNSSNLVYSNLSTMIANQLNSITQSLDIPVDLGLSYQQNEGGKDVFDVDISTQLFNDRVIVNGSVGNRRYSAQSDDSMVGDLDIGIKLNDQDNLRLNLFSHSADDYTAYLDNTQRSGVGLSFQQEFDNIFTYIKSLFTSKDRNKETAKEEKATRTIKITDNE